MGRDKKAVVRREALPAGRRIVAVSDIHGNLAWFKGLLDAVAFSANDILVLVGDLMEKGPDSLGVLRCAMELARTHTVYALAGNCDTIALNLAEDNLWSVQGLLDYLKVHGESVLHQMAAEAGFSISGERDLARLARALHGPFAGELAFLRDMPTILETPSYVFVHGGVPSYERMEELDAWSCMKNDDFLGQGRSFPKFCIVGHWPVPLYHKDVSCCESIIDRERKIASIDGGCCVVPGGQLNALVIPEAGSEDFQSCHYDDYPVGTALDPQAPSPDPVTIHWHDRGVEVLRAGREFSLCRHLSSGRTVRVLNKYLFHHPDGTWCEDSTDYRLRVEPGEQLSIVERTGRAYLVKKDGVVGWYAGRLETAEKSEKSV